MPRTRVGDRASHDTDLEGIMSDMTSMRIFFHDRKVQIANTLLNAQNPLSKVEVMAYVTQLFSDRPTTRHFIIYYSGHGTRGSGNWCVTDTEYVSLQEILDKWDQANVGRWDRDLLIIADCCFSGSWVDHLRSRGKTDVHMSASCRSNETCSDTFEGGVFTRMFVKAEHGFLDCPLIGFLLDNETTNLSPPFNPCSTKVTKNAFEGIFLPQSWAHVCVRKSIRGLSLESVHDHESRVPINTSSLNQLEYYKVGTFGQWCSSSVHSCPCERLLRKPAVPPPTVTILGCVHVNIDRVIREVQQSKESITALFPQASYVLERPAFTSALIRYRRGNISGSEFIDIVAPLVTPDLLLAILSLFCCRYD